MRGAELLLRRHGGRRCPQASLCSTDDGSKMWSAGDGSPLLPLCEIEAPQVVRAEVVRPALGAMPVQQPRIDHLSEVGGGRLVGDLVTGCPRR